LGGLRYRVLEGCALDISSSEIRQHLREGKNVSHWLPPGVNDYIRKHRLYQTLA
jgi:nicotinic acid mononucleotide adenylyltransferase